MPRIVSLLRLVYQHPESLRALLSWPVFSITSYQILKNVSALRISPASVIDIGANIGQFAVAAANIFPRSRIVAFEPNPEAYRKLDQSLRKYPRAVARQCALGSVAGEQTLHINSHSQSSSLLSLTDAHLQSFPNAKTVSTVSVRVSTLDYELQGEDIVGPCILKLDVQGYEAAVLAGGSRTLQEVDYVLCEASFKQLYEGETLFVGLLHMLEQLGFEFLRPVGLLSDPKTGEPLQIDALFKRSEDKRRTYA